MRGPYTGHQLKSFAATGKITHETLVSDGDADAWKAVGAVDELANLFGPPPSLAPSFPLDAHWYVFIDRQVRGPYTRQQLTSLAAEGQINRETQVSHGDADTWKAVIAIDELANLFSAPPPPEAARKFSAAPNARPARVGDTAAPVGDHARVPVPLDLLDAADRAPLSPIGALLLSLLLCGGGQMYCGHKGKGFLMLFACVLLWFVYLGWVITIWSMIDAYSTAEAKNLEYMAAMQDEAAK